MKKILIILSMGLLCLNLSAQTTENEQPSAAKEFKSGVHFEPAFTERIIRFGVRGGINFCNSYSSGDKNRLGANIGIVAEIPLAANVYMEPGLRYSLKGWKYNYSDEDYINKGVSGFHCIELTLPFGLKFPINETVSVFADLGIFGGYCLLGHYSRTYKDGKETGTYKGGFGGGGEINIGAEIFKRYKIALGYDGSYYSTGSSSSNFSNLHLDLTVMF